MLERIQRLLKEIAGSPDLTSALELTVLRLSAWPQVDACMAYLGRQAELSRIAAYGVEPDWPNLPAAAPHEGLVGWLCQHLGAINLADAHLHTRYAAQTESLTEQTLRGFLGVPLVRYGACHGALVLRAAARAPFDDATESALLTLAASLGNVLAQVQAHPPPPLVPLPSQVYIGQPGAPGFAVGVAVVSYPAADLDAVPDRPYTDLGAELEHFFAALVAVQEDFQRLELRLGNTVADEDRALFTAYRLMLESDTLIDAVTRHVEAGLWVPAALREAIHEQVSIFEGMDDAYLRERAQDIRDLGRRLLRKLQAEPDRVDYPAETILVGETVDVAQLAEVPQGQLRGVLVLHGSVTSHVAILARALGIPAVLGAAEVPVTRLDGQMLILDGYRGRAYLAPPPSLIGEYRQRLAHEQALSAHLLEIAHLPARTPDGVRVELHLNTGLLADLDFSLQCGAEGVGLYRTEFPYLARDCFPTEATQTQIYQHVLHRFAPRPVVMRTLDIGGDKQLSYFPINELNPFLGWRGVRISLDHPEILLAQMRAMLRAAVGLDNLRLLLPMISTIAQVDQLLDLLRRAHADVLAEGIPTLLPPVGVMIEVPAAAYQIPALARRVDFFSVGTNDLTQYLLAVDRNNTQVAPLFDSLHPAVLATLQWITQAAQRCQRPLSVCGELGGDPLGAVLLLGMGVEHLSMAAGSLLRVKSIIRHFSRRTAAELLTQALACESGSEVRTLVQQALAEADLSHLLTRLP